MKCVKTSPDGKEVTLKVLMPGDLFCCEAAVFDGAPHPGCAQPMGEVSVLRLRKQAYFDMLTRNPETAVEVIKYLGTRFNEAQEQNKVLALDGAEQRLAGLLIRSCRAIQHTGGNRTPPHGPFNPPGPCQYGRYHDRNGYSHHQPV